MDIYGIFKYIYLINNQWDGIYPAVLKHEIAVAPWPLFDGGGNSSMVLYSKTSRIFAPHFCLFSGDLCHQVAPLLASHVVPQHLVGFAQEQEKISQRNIPCKCKRRSQLLRVQSHKSHTIYQQLPRRNDTVLWVNIPAQWSIWDM